MRREQQRGSFSFPKQPWRTRPHRSRRKHGISAMHTRTSSRERHSPKFEAGIDDGKLVLHAPVAVCILTRNRPIESDNIRNQTSEFNAS